VERRGVLATFVEEYNARRRADEPWPTCVLYDWVAASPLALVRFLPD